MGVDPENSDFNFRRQFGQNLLLVLGRGGLAENQFVMPFEHERELKMERIRDLCSGRGLRLRFVVRRAAGEATQREGQHAYVSGPSAQVLGAHQDASFLSFALRSSLALTASS